MRLRIILVVFLYTTTAYAMQADQGWIRTEKVDAFSNAKYTEFRLKGKFLTPPQHTTVDVPELVLHCSAGEHHNGKNVYGGRLLSANLSVGSVITSGVNGVAVMYRLDDGPAKAATWSNGTAGTAIFFSDLELNTLLYSHFLPHREGTNPPVKKVVIALDEAFAAQIVIQFDMPAPTEVEQVCGVTYKKS